MKKVFLLFVFILGFLLSNNLAAHEIKPGFLEITEHSLFQYQALWKTPVQKGRPLAVLPLFPENCSIQAGDSNITNSGALTKQWSLFSTL